MEKMEKVELLRQKAGVSYEEAKNALEAHEWDVLEAMIALEKEGKTKEPQMASYSTKTEALSGEVVDNPKQSREEPSCFKRFLKWLKDLFDKANRNSLRVERKGELIVALPVSIFVLLLCLCLWVVLALVIVGLFFNVKYHFEGPDIHSVDVDINAAMDNASKTAESIKSEFSSKIEK